MKRMQFVSTIQREPGFRFFLSSFFLKNRQLPCLRTSAVSLFFDLLVRKCIYFAQLLVRSNSMEIDCWRLEMKRTQFVSTIQREPGFRFFLSSFFQVFRLCYPLFSKCFLLPSFIFVFFAYFVLYFPSNSLLISPHFRQNMIE